MIKKKTNKKTALKCLMHTLTMLSTCNNKLDRIICIAKLKGKGYPGLLEKSRHKSLMAIRSSISFGMNK